ncbi:sensor histidine kinase [Halorussus sp. AFM4]|uniref:sensor histidine kinase n=1 Tax=Halorussus sp. AFM4 TaxID=3421651 RepID=UPI003EBBBEB4
MVENQADLPADHWDVITQRLDEMEQFVEEMRDYMTLVEQDEHEFEPVSLRPTLEEQVALVQNAHENATLLVEELPDTTVLADELLGHVFRNLLRNAVEHNDKDTPKVHVSAERTSETVTVTIADNGPGIPDEHKETIRERGVQIDESTGSGFGLHLVTEAVNAYNGDLQIQDNEPEGTKVQVTLPTV